MGRGSGPAGGGGSRRRQSKYSAWRGTSSLDLGSRAYSSSGPSRGAFSWRAGAAAAQARREPFAAIEGLQPDLHKAGTLAGGDQRASFSCMGSAVKNCEPSSHERRGEPQNTVDRLISVDAGRPARARALPRARALASLPGSQRVRRMHQMVRNKMTGMNDSSGGGTGGGSVAGWLQLPVRNRHKH